MGMSRLLPSLAFFRASQSPAAAANSLHLREPVFMPARDNGSGDADDDGDDDDDDESSTPTTHHTINTSTSTYRSSSESSSSTTFTTHSSSSSFLGSGSSFSSSASSSGSIPTSTSTITTQFSSNFLTQSSSVSSTANTSVSINSSSDYASTTSSTSPSSSSSVQHNVHGLTSTTSHGLSTGVRASLACVMMFSLILFALVVCYFRKRPSSTWDQIIDEPAVSSSEVSQYWPPDSVVSRERGVLPPPPSPPRLDTAYLYSPRLDAAYPYPHDISLSPPLPGIPSASLTNDDSCIEIYALYQQGVTAMGNQSLPPHFQRPPAPRRMRPRALHEHIQDPMALGSLQLPQ
ncbi:hypothetical protein CY34DRAFT_12999 [Suillus luteus UH-Slu-Lm8-n1]|uniref:Uncharacterized protein n=1 Tax=Suillus luteus UH-Slu-Lm8-n1 TaxID=930992 RepID=A0A0D0AI80_9AGAM|nr:hypothetical protein CY34DRAFT_12999 [Suillus luteus UH-Slu-Lm8-n1]